jgi:outer membrane receptor protein involved in Fe transport
MRRCPARRSSAVLVPLLALHAALASVAAAQAPVPAPARPAARDTTARRDTTQRLPVIEVLGSVLPSAGPAVGSGVPARISLVSGEAIDSWEPRLLSDALASQPGISLYDDLGSPFKPTLVTRGFTASPVVGLPQGVSVFLDGVPVNEPDAGQVNFDLLPLEHVRRVELLSGTASLLGPNALGGAINLVTQRGDGAPSGEVELSGGSYDRFSGEGSLSGDARGSRRSSRRPTCRRRARCRRACARPAPTRTCPRATSRRCGSCTSPRTATRSSPAAAGPRAPGSGATRPSAST